MRGISGAPSCRGFVLPACAPEGQGSGKSELRRVGLRSTHLRVCPCVRACVAGAGGGHPPKRAEPCPQVPPLCAGVGEQGPGPLGPGAAAGGGGLRMAGCAALQAPHVLRGGRQGWGPRPDMAGSADGGDLAAHLPILAFSEYLGCQGPPGGAGPACNAEAVGCPVSILPLGSCGSSPRLRPQPSPSPGGPAARQRPAPGWAPGPWPEDERPVCSGPAGGRGGGTSCLGPLHIAVFGSI